MRAKQEMYEDFPREGFLRTVCGDGGEGICKEGRGIE